MIVEVEMWEDGQKKLLSVRANLLVGNDVT